MSDTKLSLFNQEFNHEIIAQDLMFKIEKELLETLWMELALYDIISFYFEGMFEAERGSLFGPIGLSGVEDGALETYFIRDRDYLKWVDLEFDLDINEFSIPNIIEGIDHTAFDLFGEKLYVFCLKYGDDKNLLNLRESFNPNELLNEFGMGDEGEWGCGGIDVKVTPNKEKIRNLLKSRNHTFGDLNEVSKLKIVESLIKTKSEPHEGPTGATYHEISVHLLELIKIHPKTSEELKVIITLSQN